jgi:hypothetical protein
MHHLLFIITDLRAMAMNRAFATAVALKPVERKLIAIGDTSTVATARAKPDGKSSTAKYGSECDPKPCVHRQFGTFHHQTFSIAAVFPLSTHRESSLDLPIEPPA